MAEVNVGQITYTSTTTGRITGYQVEVQHSGLNEHALLKAPDRYILENKLQAKLATWETKWERALARSEAEERQQKISAARLKLRGNREASKIQADEQSHAASDALESMRQILRATLSVNDAVDWTALEDHRPFRYLDTNAYPDVAFDKNGLPLSAKLKQAPARPERPANPPRPVLGIMDRIFTSRRLEKERSHSDAISATDATYGLQLREWENACKLVERLNVAAKEQLRTAQSAFDVAKAEYLARQVEANIRVQALRDKYRAGVPEAVVQNCELVLNASTYPDWLSKDFVVNFNPANGMLVVDYNLPRKSVLPTLAKVTYVQARDEFKETHISEAEHARLFDDVLYQVSLRTIHELFEADVVNAVAAITFNGWVEDVNRATGKCERSCIMSVQVAKARFAEIDLAHVDPKACFKDLRGVAASKLSGLTPVRPILQLERDDPRFVASYEVADRLEVGDNLAAMDWEDFEHLVRELFQKEFAVSGGEVKVTRASADGGVDAVAFDPDPIRGGKIVIQAKRYTNTVGVAAVRDLFGTVMNEGANKGILVTTADYGPDAYEFARGKPLTLLSGSNLLHLLEKHGHRARIDIREAKALQAK